MNKNIKLLLESLFDDLDDIFVSDDEEVNDIINRDYAAKCIADCKSEDQLIKYLIDKHNLYNDLYQLILSFINTGSCKEFTETHPDTNIKVEKNWYYKGDYGHRKEIYFDIIKFFVLDVEVKFPLIIDKEDITITFRNKPKELQQYVLLLKKDKDIIKKVPLSIYSPDKVSNQETVIREKINEEYKSKFNTELQDILYETFKLSNFKFILDELNTPGKVYKVVDKDIQRMTKCIETRDYLGFDKITKPEKMVARIAAFFIMGDKLNREDCKLKIDDKLLVQLTMTRARNIGKESFRPHSYYGRKIRSSNWEERNQVRLQVLSSYKTIPGLHLNDIIETYNAYKNKF